MTIETFVVKFHNTTKVDGVKDDDSFLYWGTANTGLIRFTPDGFRPSDKVTIRAGQIEPWQDGSHFKPKHGSVFYLFGLPKVSSDQAISGIDFGPDWISESFDDPTLGKYLACTPKHDIPINASTVTDLPINGIGVGPTNSLPYIELQLDCYNVDGMTGRGKWYVPFGLHLTMRNKPGSQPLPPLSDALEYRFLGGKERDYENTPGVEFIQLTPSGPGDGIANEFTLSLTPKSGQSHVTADASIHFTLSFPVSGGGDLAWVGPLASAADVSHIDVRAASGTNWQVYAETDQQYPSWRIVIPAGQEISGQIQCRNVVSRLDWGWTQLVLAYDGVPGYRAGQFQCPMYKYSKPMISRCVAAGVTLDDGPALYVNWLGHSVNPVSIQLWRPYHDGAVADLGDDFPQSGAIQLPAKGTKWDPQFWDTMKFSSVMPFTGSTDRTDYGVEVMLSPTMQITFYNNLNVRLVRESATLDKGVWLVGHEAPEIIEPGAIVSCLIGSEVWSDPDFIDPKQGVRGELIYRAENMHLQPWNIKFRASVWYSQQAICWYLGDQSCSADTDNVARGLLTMSTIGSNPPTQATTAGVAWECTATQIILRIIAIQLVNQTNARLILDAAKLDRGTWVEGTEPPAILAPGATMLCRIVSDEGASPMGVAGAIIYHTDTASAFHWTTSFHVDYDDYDEDVPDEGKAECHTDTSNPDFTTSCERLPDDDSEYVWGWKCLALGSPTV